MSTNSTDRNSGEASVDIVDFVDGVDRPGDATHDNDESCYRLWRIHWPEIEPTLIRYQEPVTFERVLSECRAAVAAEPMETEASTNVRRLAGPSHLHPHAGNSNLVESAFMSLHKGVM